MQYLCNSVEETIVCAETFVRKKLFSQACKVVLLEGLVGVGKSVFVRSALRTLGINGDIPSPTFSLINEYELDVSEDDGAHDVVYHVDLYRLQSDEAFFSLELGECAHEGFVFVEWAQNFPRTYYPQPHYCVSITMSAEHDAEACLQNSPAATPQARIITITQHHW